MLRSGFVLALLCVPAAHSYSVLTHEAVVDVAWEKEITPLLMKRFPLTTLEQLREAHAYAYGGCLIQDMGYYPFGRRFFSDLLHYVRTGDFVESLISESHDVNEFAFALGALAHYASDTVGHPRAVNLATPIEYPKLARRFGRVATYEDNPAAHLKVEFAFDVSQVARGAYSSEAYRDFIGFKVSKSLLERAFRDTYSLELSDVFASVDLAIGTYRHAVSSVIPQLTKTAWALHGDDLLKARPGLSRQEFVYNLSRSSYEKEWGAEYERPGVFARILAFFFRIVPKIGPFKALGFNAPSSETVRLFEASFNRTLDSYRKLLAGIRNGELRLEDANLDTGRPERPAEYRMADAAYAELAQKLASKDPAEVGPAVRNRILAHFEGPEAPAFADEKERRKAAKALETLRLSAAAR